MTLDNSKNHATSYVAFELGSSFNLFFRKHRLLQSGVSTPGGAKQCNISSFRLFETPIGT